MTIENTVFRIAGSLILISLALAYFFSPAWLILNGFIGAAMLQASFTGFCPMVRVLRRLGLKSGPVA